MLLSTLPPLYARELGRLYDEIAAYPDESQLWALAPGIANSAGNLCLHIIGNLHHFIGAEFGKTGYVRDRPLEFSAKDVPRAELLARIVAAKAVVLDALEGLTEEDLAARGDYMKSGEPIPAAQLLVHLLGHLNYHLGQINYHRRLLA
jgi:uncharacterized damage-inducible protein DinB